MAGHSALAGVSTALLVIISVVLVKGVPLPQDRLSTDFEDIKSLIFNETVNKLRNGPFDRHIACRACKQIIINGRFALIVEKNAISTYFTDPCDEFFDDPTDQKNCKLVIQEKVDTVCNRILNILNTQYWCKDVIHLCPGKAEYAEVDNKIPTDL